MKKAACIALATVALLLAYSIPSQAHSHFRGGIVIGPLWGPWWPQPYYQPYQPYQPYYPSTPPVVVQQQPEEYLEPQPQQQTWYYCSDPQGYYPYVKQCPQGWRRVAPTPPPEQE